jgi:lysozyme family protein
MRASDTAYYVDLFATVKFDEQIVASVGTNILRNEQRYETVQAATGVPWWLIAILHTMEASGSFRCQILNGQRWTEKTTIVPKGWGPWPDWESSTMFAVKHHKLDLYATWDVPSALRRFESWNGWGYRNRGVHSPYVWGMSNHAHGVGKFVADGRYDPNAETKQVGAGVLLRWLSNHGCVTVPVKKMLIGFDPNGNHRSDMVHWYQAAYNELLETHDDLRHLTPLVVDGWAGSSTSTAHHRVFGRYLEGDPQNSKE